MSRKRKRPNFILADQQRIVLSYGALRNALGNYGRLGTDVALLTPAPTFTDTDLIIHELPRDGQKVLLFDREGEELERHKTHGAEDLTVSIEEQTANQLAWIEVYDYNKTPVRLGLPIRTTDTQVP